MKNLVVFILVSMLLTGCTGGGTVKSEPQIIKLELAGFPNSSHSEDFYLVVLGVYKDNKSEILDERLNVKPKDIILTDLQVAGNIQSLHVYLYSSPESIAYEPLYYWAEPITDSETDYKMYYWINNIPSKYGELQFGISEVFVIDYNEIRETGFYLDFDYAPYYVIKVPAMEEVWIECMLQSDQGRILMDHRLSISDKLYGDYSVELRGEHTFLEKFPQDTFLIFRPGDYLRSTSGSIRFNQNSGLKIEGLTRVVPSSRDNLIFGFNEISGLLHYINPVTKELEGTYKLPYNQFTYCPEDELIYFYKYDFYTAEVEIGVWDIDACSLKRQQRLKNGLNRGFEVVLCPAPSLERLFLCTSGAIYEFDLETLELVNETSLYSNRPSWVEVNGFTEQLYISVESDRNRLFRYSITNNGLTLEQVLSYNGWLLGYERNKNMITIFENNRVKSFSGFNLASSWYTSDYTGYMPTSMSSDGQYLYGRNHEEGINGEGFFILDKDTLKLKRKLSLSDRFMEFVLSIDNNTALVYDSEYLYFVDTFLNQESIAEFVQQETYRESLNDTHLFSISTIAGGESNEL